MIEIKQNFKERNLIECEQKELWEHEDLQFVAQCRDDNKYFWVKGTNAAILAIKPQIKVEEEIIRVPEKWKCILLDNKVQVYNQEEECSLPIMLSAYHYAVYDKHGREWVQRTNAKNTTIGNDIIRIVKGYTKEMARIDGYTLDHLAEIFNEKLKNIEYGNDTTRHSHRYYIDIKDKCDLDELIELIKEDDKYEESRYIFKKKK